MSLESHYAIRDLLDLPGMPESKTDKIESKIRAIQMLAKREGWDSRKRPGRGGGCEYAFASLPKATQEHLQSLAKEASMAAAASAAVPAVAKSSETALALVPSAELPAPSAMKQKQCTIMNARMGFMRFIEASPSSVTETIDYLVKNAQDGTLPPELQPLVSVANAKAGNTGRRKLSTRSLWKWWSEYRAAGGNCSALAPVSNVKRIEPAWAQAFMKEWRKGQKPRLTEVLDELAKSIPAGLPMPSYDQARRYLRALGAIELNRGRMTGNALANLKPYRRRLTDHMYPGDAYTADGHTFDAEVAHPYHGRPFRPEITPVLDIATRLVVGWSCDLAESGLAVLDALRGACELFGPPVIFYTDNGKGYKNQMLTAEGTGILHRLGITPEYSRPRNPKAHGISERAHQSVLIKAARELCTYIGKEMDPDTKQLVFKMTRKEIKTGENSGLLIEWEEFVERVNQAIQAYNRSPHTGLPAYRDPVTKKRVHFTPEQAWIMGMQRMQKDLPREEWLQPATELPDLYHPAVTRKVDRGWIRFGNSRHGQPKMYYSPDLANWTGLEVQVAFSPSDSSQVWVRELEHGRLIAVAKLNGNADHYFAPSYLDEKREKRADARLKRLSHQVEEIELERLGKQPITIPAEAAAAREALQITLAAEPVPALPGKVKAVFSLPPTQRGKYHYWCEIDARIGAGEEVNEDEKRFHSGFQTSAAWKTERMLDTGSEPLQAAR